MLNRINNVKRLLAQLGLDACIITNESDIFYISSFRCADCILLITGNTNYLITDSRYILMARDVAGEYFEILQCNVGAVSCVRDLLNKLNLTKVGIQDKQMTLYDYTEYSVDSNIKYYPLGDSLLQIRAQKDENELSQMKKAQEITDAAFEYILGFIKRGITEIDIALELGYYMLKNGASSLSFDSIVASGPNAAIPHAVPTDRVIRDGDMITLDFGCVVNGYCSDMTRTISVGKPSTKFLEIYDVVLTAHNMSKSALRANRSTKDIDAIARKYIASCGFGEYFGHGLGHGVGIDIHELPVVSYRSDVLLSKGNIITIEPGIYIPKFGGVRIENMCYITDDGYYDITKSDNKLIII